VPRATAAGTATGTRGSWGRGKIEPLDLWNTELLDSGQDTIAGALCSAHYFDFHQNGFVAQGWYQQGLRLLDVGGDDIRQVGYYITPTVMAWAAHYPPTDKTGEIIYAFDATRGIDVLRFDRPKRRKDMPTVTAPILPQWRTSTLTPSGAFGYACLLPT
jgi:hypothetical protein